MPLYTANAIVLRRINFGETDRIVTLLTRERGKISAIAKGSRKPISRLAGPTEIMTYSRMQLATGRNLDIITQIEVKESFPAIRSELRKIAHATYLMELVDRMTEEHERNANLFDTLLSALYLMERPNDPEKITHMFELQFMRILGYEPVLDRCVRCAGGSSATPVPADELYFSPSLGGIACRECGPLPEDAIQIMPETAETMSRLLAARAPEVETMEIPPAVMDQIGRVMRWFIRFHSEREIKSAEFLQAIRTEE